MLKRRYQKQTTQNWQELRPLLKNATQLKYDYQSPQLDLWPKGEVEWFVILRMASPSRRRHHNRHLLVFQPPLFDGEVQER